MTPTEESRLHRAFVWSVALKGIDAALEIAAAFALAVVDAGAVSGFLMHVAHKELVNHPADLIAGWLRDLAASYSVSAKTFAVIYLASHGIVKMVLVVGLLREKTWAYPASILVFAGFIAYQVYRYSFTRSVFLIVLTGFDLIVVALVWNEWRQRRLVAAGAG
jgi:uncharacterized membrane protein